MDVEILKDTAATEVGSYFVANYPPFSVWSPEHVAAAKSVLDSPPVVVADGGVGSVGDTERPHAPLGLYLHIPFCRKRCKFCYFRVYTDKNSSDVEVYLDALTKEIELYANCAVTKGREFEFVYFGGGTPSFLSGDQLQGLIDRVNKHWTWSAAKEVTFECEPGTLKKSKLETIKAIGVTRLSLGVEHFDDGVLSLNGRAHKSPEIFLAYGWAREVGFDEINIDLIAGMLGDTESLWKETVGKALELDPDSITIYQMELPHNTTIAQDAKSSGTPAPVADWVTKRAWVAYAFEVFERAGYVVSSAYTLVKNPQDGGFVYRDSLWHGADMIGMGVASFSYVGGMHYQNFDGWDDYVGALAGGALPLARAFPSSHRQRMIRELILQLKTGSVDAAYFDEKFGLSIAAEFGDAVDSLVAEEFATWDGARLSLTRSGLLRADALLPRFFEPQFRDVRYT